MLSLYGAIQCVEELLTHRRFRVATSRNVRQARPEQTEFRRLELASVRAECLTCTDIPPKSLLGAVHFVASLISAEITRRMEQTANRGLSQFPPLILDLILRSKSLSYLVLRLWTCGNSQLNLNLAAGITYMNLKASWSLQIGFPSMLLKLRNLRYLSIKVKGKLMRHPLYWKDIVLSLPSSLETLKLVCSDCDYILRNFAPEWTYHTPSYIESDYGTSRSPMIDISQHLTRLTRLEIFGVRGKDPIPFFARDLPVLPSTITDLRVSLQRQGHPLMMSLLPQSLIRLRLSAVGPANPLGIDDWLSCPPNLQHIGTIHYYYPQIDFSWIPRTLRHLNIQKMGLNSSDFTPQSSLSLPPNYESMITRIDTSARASSLSPPDDLPLSFWPSHLSPHLTSLTITSGEIIASSLKDLPKSLVDLTIAETTISGWEEMPQAHEWPLHLRLFHATQSNFPPKRLNWLPRSLTDLSIRFSGSVSEIDPETLSPVLTALRIELNSSSSDILALTGPILSNLKSLELCNSGPGRESHVIGVGKNGRDWIPSTLTCLKASLELSARDWMTHRNIVTLKLGQWRFKDFALLPRSLTFLHILLTDSSNDSKARIDFTEHLPSSLTELQLRGDYKSGNDWNTASFSNLPRLRSVTLENFRFPSGILRNLPRSLKKLDTVIMPWLDEDIPFIPPYLEVLGRAHVDWKSPLIAQYWPLADTKGILEPALSVIEERKKSHGIP